MAVASGVCNLLDLLYPSHSAHFDTDTHSGNGINRGLNGAGLSCAGLAFDFVFGEGDGVSFGLPIGVSELKPVGLFWVPCGLPPLRPLACCFSWFLVAFSYSASRRLCTIDSPSMVKKGITAERILAHDLLSARQIKESCASSFGSRPARFHAVSNSNRYAPCCSVERCMVSAM